MPRSIWLLFVILHPYLANGLTYPRLYPLSHSRARTPYNFPSRAVVPNAPVTMSLSKVSLYFDFDRIPYAAGIHHIHSPEHVSGTHRLGAPFFNLESVDAPKINSDKKVSISFTCSTLFLKDLRVRMFSSQPNESNMLFFKDNRALYNVRFTVVPIKAFLAHRLKLDVTFFAGNGLFRATVKSLMPIFLFINGMEDKLGYSMPVRENANFTEYRRLVLRGKSSDEFWIMAERVLREYSA